MEYRNSPDGQVISTPVSFNKYLGGAIHDTGMLWNTGGTFGALYYSDGVLMFRPLYSGLPYNGQNQAAAKNGVVLRWFGVMLIA